MHYLLTFIGHIDVHKKPDGFPHHVSDTRVVTSDTAAGAVQAINDGYMVYVRMLGMHVRMDPAKLEAINALEYDRVWVPMHMITHITHALQPIQDTKAVMNITSGMELPASNGEGEAPTQ